MGTCEAGPDGDSFYDLYGSVEKPQLVRIALELDVFTALAQGPLDAAALAESAGANAEGITRLADYLVAIGLLTKTHGSYSLTPCAETFLVRTSKAYAGDLLVGFAETRLWDSVMRSVRSGESTFLLERFDQDAWVESFRAARVESSLEMWRAAGVAPAAEQDVRILDLACGCGIKSFSLAQAHPSVSVVCLDRPDVLAAAEDLAARMGIAERVTLAPGDLTSADLGSGIYDACLAGQITHYLTEEQDLDLFRRVHKALKDSGRFVIDVPMGAGELDEVGAFLSLVLWANSRGTAYSYEAYERLLRSSGFERVERAGERWIVARR